nr:hypothetical protein [Tanacetum cinerariifolium]
MRRVGKGFSGVDTSLFGGMLVAGVIEEENDAEEQVQDVAEDVATQGADIVVIGDAVQDQSIPSPTLLTPPPQQPQDLPSTSQRINSSDDTVMEDASNQGRMIDDLDIDVGVALMNDKEVVDVVTTAKLITEVVTTASESVTAASESVTAASTTISTVEPQVPTATIIVNVAIDHVKQKAKEDPFVQRYQVMKKRPQTEAQARKNMIM